MKSSEFDSKYFKNIVEFEKKKKKKKTWQQIIYEGRK